MFEILKALLAMQDAAQEHGAGFWWNLAPENGVGPVLKIEVALTADDVEFVEQMRQLVGPA
jgi:hypothetical protein